MAVKLNVFPSEEFLKMGIIYFPLSVNEVGYTLRFFRHLTITLLIMRRNYLLSRVNCSTNKHSAQRQN